MNKENAHLYLPLVQALSERKTIQVYNGSFWDDLSDPEFTRPHQDYRVKPGPRTFWVNEYSNRSFGAVNHSREEADRHAGDGRSRTIKLVEVTEDV